MYLYLSRPKLAALKQEWHGQSVVEWLKQFALRFKWSYDSEQSVEAQLVWKPNNNDIHLVEEIERRIKESGIEKLEDLIPEQNTGLFLFRGPARPQVARDIYLVCMQVEKRGCLLAGSVHNAVGGPPEVNKRLNGSVTADPVNAIRQLATPAPDGSADPGLMWPLSNVFGSITAETEGLSLPVLEGIAVYAGRVAAQKSEINRVGGSSVEEIVIGSPIFVRHSK
jgi:hypothetical protein